MIFDWLTNKGSKLLKTPLLRKLVLYATTHKKFLSNSMLEEVRYFSQWDLYTAFRILQTPIKPSGFFAFRILY